MNWREEHTQCLHRKKDGTRCQLDTAPGDYVCGHHTIGLEDIFEDPMAVVAKFRLYFPKNHHPACDRKGQNDCDCPDRTFGELLGARLQASRNRKPAKDKVAPSNGSSGNARQDSIDSSLLQLDNGRRLVVGNA